jgi:hypothetical protein
MLYYGYPKIQKRPNTLKISGRFKLELNDYL